MKLEKYVDKSVKRRKAFLISISVIVLISVSLLLYKTFASFTETAEFPMMKGKVDYFGNSDIYFVFYQGDELLEEMPQKDNEEGLIFERGECDNGASIEWNIDEWAPLVKGLNSPKTKCSLYFFKDTKALRRISSNDSNGMWGYKDKLTKIVIENTKSIKEAPEGGKVYGPFDESEHKSKAVESYVVCEADDTNCVGYLQSNCKVIVSNYADNLFYNYSEVTTIEGLNNLDTSNSMSMQSMFSGMSSLTSLELNGFNTSHVDNMSNMFENCSSLELLDLSMFDTTYLNNISGMFSDMLKLQELNLSNWKFNNNLTKLFVNNVKLFNDPLLKSIVLNNVNTSQVTDISGMFAYLGNNNKLLETLDLSSFDTSHVTNMQELFKSSTSLQTLDLSSWDTSEVKEASEMFYEATGLTQLNISNWDFSNIQNCKKFLELNNSLAILNMTNFIFPSDSSNFFTGGLGRLNEIILTDSNTSYVTNMHGMFSTLSNINNIDLSSWDTSNVSDFGTMFWNTQFSKIIFGPKFVYKSGALTAGMFANCRTSDRPTDSSWQGVSFD